MQTGRQAPRSHEARSAVDALAPIAKFVLWPLAVPALFLGIAATTVFFGGNPTEGSGLQRLLQAGLLLTLVASGVEALVVAICTVIVLSGSAHRTRANVLALLVGGAYLALFGLAMIVAIGYGGVSY